MYDEATGTVRVPRIAIATPRRAVSPASAAQRLKAREGCRVHGKACGNADPMHVIDRSLGGCDDPCCTVPGCRAVHDAYDNGRFDLLPYLSIAEQAHAVAHVGIERARRRITNNRGAAGA